ncbi:MAG: hypothetical protein H7X80_11460 [bacterium]|nr:hypothetical protein [Candidatus Kapabacteria bacterium]
MLRSVLHVLCTILLLASYTGERWMPCVETCIAGQEAPSNAPHADDAHKSGDDHHDGEVGGDCSHCTCCCRVQAPAVAVVPQSPFVREIVLNQSRSTQIPPSATVDSIDHVPLA